MFHAADGFLWQGFDRVNAWDSARVGLGELDGYGDTSTKNIDAVVEQYQAMPDEMPNLVAKYSEPCSN